MIKGIRDFWLGQLEIEIKGNALNRFINQINELGIRIWNIRRIKYDYYLAVIYKRDFNKLRPLLRKRKCKVKIIEKKGLPFLLFNIKKRIFLLIGLIIFLSIFYTGSSFIWFYDINGLEIISEEEVKNLLFDFGLKRGVLRKAIDTSILENYLTKNIGEISWVDVRWRGTRLIIDIVEKKIITPIKSGELVAARDGIITEIIVLKGQGVVKEGDTVSKGQVLVVPELKSGEARAIIKANVWYDTVRETHTSIKMILYTGRVKTFWGVKIGSSKFYLTNVNPPFNQYKRIQELKKIFRWRNIELPIELIKEEHQELTLYKENWSYQLALFKAREKAFAEILALLNNDTIIEDVSEQILVDDKTNIKLRLLVKVEENIACLKEESSGRD